MWIIKKVNLTLASQPNPFFLPPFPHSFLPSFPSSSKKNVNLAFFANTVLGRMRGKAHSHTLLLKDELEYLQREAIKITNAHPLSPSTLTFQEFILWINTEGLNGTKSFIATLFVIAK